MFVQIQNMVQAQMQMQMRITKNVSQNDKNNMTLVKVHSVCSMPGGFIFGWDNGQV